MNYSAQILENSIDRVRTQSSACRRLLKQLQAKSEEISACYALAHEQSSHAPLYNVKELENDANSLKLQLLTLISTL